MSKKKTYIPTGKSKIRLFIKAVLENEGKSLAEDTSKVTISHIENYLGQFVVNFTPKTLESGSKFITQIKNKSVVDGEKLFKKDSRAYNALTMFSDELSNRGSINRKAKAYRSPKEKFSRKAAAASEKAKRDLKGRVMGTVDTLWIVTVKEKREKAKEKIIGGFSTGAQARAAAKAYLSGLKKAYDPLIPLFKTGTTKKGNVSRTQKRLKIETFLRTKKKIVKGEERRVNTGEAKYTFENDDAMQYVKDQLKQPNLVVEVLEIKSPSEHKAYWKLFNSPAIGKMRWNPKSKR